MDRDLGNKLVTQEYDSKMQQETFTDWLVCVESVFAHKPNTEDHKVTLVATGFRGYVAIWWTELRRCLSRQNIDPVKIWAEMRNLMKQKFVPLNYQSDLFFTLQP